MEKLIKIWTLFEWAFKARAVYNERWFKRILKRAGYESLGTEQLALAFWLTYIYNYQVPASRVWNKCFPIMAYASEKFHEGTPADEILESILRDNGKKLVHPERGIEFKHRFASSRDKAKNPNHSLRKTLETIEELHRRNMLRKPSLLEYIFHFIDEDEHWVRTLAKALYALTYDASSYNYSLFQDPSKLKDYQEKYKGHKRLWAALSDYLTGYLHKRIDAWAQENVKDKRASTWRDAPTKPEVLQQLELPGDRWNEEFFSRIRPLLPEDLKKLRHARIIARKLFEKLPQEYKRRFYPIQLDTSFDLARNMCSEHKCDLCPLGPDGADKICIKGKANVYCPVLLLAFGYKVECNPEKCPIYNGEVRGVCPTPLPDP